MENSIKIVKDILEKNNIEIYKEGLTGEEYNIVCGEIILFVKEGEVSIAFQATTKPEDAASYTLLMIETKLKVVVMESFILDSNYNMVTGDNAHELIKSKEYEMMMKEVLKDKVLTEMLLNTNCYNC
jgi:glyoxylate utilization-related uncharacterized protein